MNELQTYMQKDFVEFKKFECKDLSYSVFENVDFHEYLHLVSFFRSDFRGTKFSNVKFYKNNFDRGDFLNTIFINCDFEKVQFGCCQMKNCYFKNAKFRNSLYKNTSIHSTTFVDCEFPDETFLINMQHCKLINCKFKGCTFEMSTTDSDFFEKCKFENTNLATMHAENHKFVDCEFQNVYLGSSYFFGYSIANCNWNQVFLLYRGEAVQLENFRAENILKKFEQEHRYNDMLNFYINRKLFDEIPNLLKDCFEYYKDVSYGRMLDIAVLFHSLIFASKYETVDYHQLHQSLSIIMDIDMSNFTFDERIEVESLCTKFKSALYLSPHSQEFLAKIETYNKSAISIRIDCDEYEKCVSIANNLLDTVSEKNNWVLVDKQKGSWILVYSAATVVVLAALPKIIKNYSDVYFDIKTKKALSQKVQKKIEEADVGVKEIGKLASAAHEAELLMPAGKTINNNVSREIIDIPIASITANM